MNLNLQYKNFFGIAVLNTNDGIWYGKVIGYHLPNGTTCTISDVITFQSIDINKLKDELAISVDEYLDMFVNN